jgi:hypothetical protein
MKVMAFKSIVEAVKSWWDAVALGRWHWKADVIDDGSPNEVGIAGSMGLEDASKCAHKQERAEGIPLCNSFMEGVRDDVVHGEGSGGVRSEVDARRCMVEKAEPRCKEGAIEVTDCFPQIIASHVVKGFFQVTWYNCASACRCSLSKFHEFFAASWYCNSKVERRYKLFLVSVRKGFGHDHEGSNSNKALSYTKVAELDDCSVRALVKQSSFEFSCPVAEPRQGSTCKVFKEGNKNSPAGVLVLVGLLSNGEAGEELNPIEAKARNARWWSGWAGFNISMDGMAVKDKSATGEGERDINIDNHGGVEGRELLKCFRAKWSDRLLFVEHLHRIVEVKVPGQPGSSLCICSEGSVLGFRVVSRSTTGRFGSFVSWNMSIYNAIHGRESNKSM